MKMPKPGRPARGTSTGRPIMVLLDLLGRRMALRILWELRGPEPMSFRALQEAADTNPSVLNTRLTELREARLVAHDGAGYALTILGRELLSCLLPLQHWADDWAKKLVSGSASRTRP